MRAGGCIVAHAGSGNEVFGVRGNRHRQGRKPRQLS
jgi:hypothetical protein